MRGNWAARRESNSVADRSDWCDGSEREDSRRGRMERAGSGKGRFRMCGKKIGMNKYYETAMKLEGNEEEGKKRKRRG